MQPANHALVRFGAALDRASHLPARPSEQPAIEEIQALNDIDIALLPEEMDLAAFEATAHLLQRQSAADDLRVPSPSRWRGQSLDHPTPFRSASRCLETFKEKSSQPAAKHAQDAEREARLMSLLSVILDLQEEIYAKRDMPR